MPKSIKLFATAINRTSEEMLTVNFPDGAVVTFSRTNQQVTLFSHHTIKREDALDNDWEGTWEWKKINTLTNEQGQSDTGSSAQGPFSPSVTNYKVELFSPNFDSAASVRAFFNGQGFNSFNVRWRDNPFGGSGRFFVALAVPDGVSLIHSSGSNISTTTGYFKNEDPSKNETAQKFVSEIANLRKILKGTNVSVDH
jgi:hypothetical protein